MKAVILAAGKSTRTYPLTLTKPKPLLKIAGKTLIEHNLDHLEGIVDEVIIIVGYLSHMIKSYLGNSYKGIKITYLEQEEQLGTGHALSQAKKHLGGKFFVLMGDDLYAKEDLVNCSKKDAAILAQEVDDPSRFGVIVHEEGALKQLVEKPKEFISSLANTGCYVFDASIFSLLESVEKSDRGEFEITSAVQMLAMEKKVSVVQASNWNPIGYPWNLLEIDQKMRKENSVGSNTLITGKVENSSIGKQCIINGDVKNSIIGDHVVISKGSIVENSIIGDKTKFDGETKTGEVSFDVKGNSVLVKDIGAIIGSHCRLQDVKTSPGTRVGPYVHTSSKKLEGKVQ